MMCDTKGDNNIKADINGNNNSIKVENNNYKDVWRKMMLIIAIDIDDINNTNIRITLMVIMSIIKYH